LDLLFNDYLLFFFRSEGNLFLIQGGAKSACRKGPVHRAKLRLWEQIKRRGAVYRELERLAAIARLDDLTLICWCKERDKDVDCHGDLLKRAIEWLTQPPANK
jgi:hypothetical protein